MLHATRQRQPADIGIRIMRCLAAPSLAQVHRGRAGEEHADALLGARGLAQLPGGGVAGPAMAARCADGAFDGEGHIADAQPQIRPRGQQPLQERHEQVGVEQRQPQRSPRDRHAADSRLRPPAQADRAAARS